MKKAIIYVLIFNFLQGAINNLGHPVTPALVESMEIPDYMFGVFFSTMSFGLMLGGPIWGILGDYGDKRVYVSIGLIFYSIGQVMFAYVGNMYWMVFFRFLSGFSVAASITLLLSYVIEISHNDNRKKYLAWSAALITAGTSVGYFVGGKLNEIQWFINVLNTDDYRMIFLIQGILNLGLAAFVFVVIQKRVKAKQNNNRPKIIQGFKDIKKLEPNLIIFLLSLTLISIAMINISKFIDVHLNTLGYSPGDIGTFVFATGIVSIITSIFIVPLLIKLHRDFKLLIWIQVFSAIIVFGVFRAERILMLLYTVFMIYVILKAVYKPLEQNYIASYADETSYGKIMGVRQAFFAIGMVIGPLIGGVLYDVKPLFVFDFSVLMFVVGLILLLIIQRNLKRQQN